MPQVQLADIVDVEFTVKGSGEAVDPLGDMAAVAPTILGCGDAQNVRTRSDSIVSRT
jgi:hypothetical protein